MVLMMLVTLSGTIFAMELFTVQVIRGWWSLR